MKKIIKPTIMLLMLFMVSGCAWITPPSSSQLPISSEQVSSNSEDSSNLSVSSSLQVQKEKLNAPMNLHYEDGVLEWNIVENAKEYIVNVNSKERVVTTNYFDVSSLELSNGSHSAKVKAVGSENYESSDYSSSITFMVSYESENENPNQNDKYSNYGQSMKLNAYRGEAKPNPELVNIAISEGKYYAFYFDLGVIKRTPIYVSNALQYTKHDLELSLDFQTITEETIENSISKSIETIDTRSYTGGFEIGFSQETEVGAGVGKVGLKANFIAEEKTDHHWTQNWGNVKNENESTTNSYMNSYSNGYSLKLNVSQDNGFIPNRYYRLAFYESVKSYGVFYYDFKTESYTLLYENVLVANQTIMVIEESDEYGNFNYDSNESLSFDADRAFEIVKANMPDNIQFAIENVSNGSAEILSVNGKKVDNNYQYKIGDVVEVKATPNSGYKFCNWNKNGEELVNEYSPIVKFTLDRNTVIKPVFYSSNKLMPLINGMSTYEFSADVYTESRRQGQANFKVVGLPVLYGGEEYIYGNAYYTGNMNGTRMDDVARFSLICENTKVLFGGTVSWNGTLGDTNEAGMGGWDSTYTHNNREVSYLHAFPGSDFAGNEEVNISIIGICVKTNRSLSKDVSKYPEIETMDLSVTIKTEDKTHGRANFNMYGIKATYNYEEYFIGTAYFSGKTGGVYYSDISHIEFLDASQTIVNGGLMTYRGDKDNSNACGVVISNEMKGDSNSCRYMMENGDNDYPGDRDITINITNMCLKLSNELDENTKYVPMDESIFKTTIFAEENNFGGYVDFNTFGLSLIDNNEQVIYGYSSYVGPISGERINDCAYLEFKLDSGYNVISGGYLQFEGKFDDWNTQSGNTSYCNGKSNQITYYAYNAGDDYSAKEFPDMRFQINGIMLVVKK